MRKPKTYKYHVLSTEKSIKHDLHKKIEYNKYRKKEKTIWGWIWIKDWFVEEIKILIGTFVVTLFKPLESFWFLFELFSLYVHKKHEKSVYLSLQFIF